MLENKLVTVQKRIQEPCHIEDRSLCDSSKQKNPEKRSLLSQNTYFRCGKVPDEMSRKIIFKFIIISPSHSSEPKFPKDG